MNQMIIDASCPEDLDRLRKAIEAGAFGSVRVVSVPSELIENGAPGFFGSLAHILSGR